MDEEYDIRPSQTATLKEVDSVEIISLIDNSIDFLSSIEKKGVQQVREVGERKERGGMVQRAFSSTHG